METWSDPDWLAEAHSWIEAQLTQRGMALTGPIEQPHVVWWSTALRVPVGADVVWFKAMQPDGAFETRLAPFLATRWPQHSAEVLATEPERGWMLSCDAGVRLRDIGDGRSPFAHWEALLPQYAELQIAAAAHRETFEAMGVPDRSLGTIRADLERALEEPESLLLGQQDGLSADDHQALREGRSEFGTLCERLAGYGIPDSIQHDDFHDGNVFVRDGGYVFFDWGDACISHPFHSLVVALRSVAYATKVQPGGPQILRMRNAYLEPWSRHASRAELVEVADLARRTGTIGRAMAWRRYAMAMPPAERADALESVPYGLRLYLADGPWGSWDDGTF